MTISESLQGNTTYPIPSNTIEKLCVLRGLVGSTTFTQAIGLSKEYQLCEADLYMFLYTAPDLKEQEVSLTLADRKNYLGLANGIYGKYEDANFTGKTYGNRGEDWNAR